MLQRTRDELHRRERVQNWVNTGFNPPEHMEWLAESVLKIDIGVLQQALLAAMQQKEAPKAEPAPAAPAPPPMLTSEAGPDDMLHQVEPHNSAHYTIDQLRAAMPDPPLAEPSAAPRPLPPPPPELAGQPVRWAAIRAELDEYYLAIGRGEARQPAMHPSGRGWRPHEPRTPRHLTPGYYDAPREEWRIKPLGSLGPDPGSRWLHDKQRRSWEPSP
jgi:hypothetical protein